MMYRILRNNKEQGPLNLDELLKLSLRPYDLIWIEGKSTSWRYPSEIDNLQSHLDHFITKAEVKESLPVIIKTPVTTFQCETELQTNTPEESELTADFLEQKANAIYQRIQAYNARCEQQEKDVHTKYVRSLDDLKQDYADWLHGKKQKRKGFALDNKGWMAFGAMCTAFIFFVLAGRDIEEVPILNSTTNLVSHSSSEAKIFKPEAPINVAHNPNQTRKESIYKKTSVDAFIDSVRRVLNKQEVFKGPVIDHQVKNKTTKSQMYSSDSASIVLSPFILESTNIVQPAITTADVDFRFIESKSKDSHSELKITVYNTGTNAIERVAIDVYLYKKKETLLYAETIHINNIRPGSSYTLVKPVNKKTMSAFVELGTITPAK